MSVLDGDADASPPWASLRAKSRTPSAPGGSPSTAASCAVWPGSTVHGLSTPAPMTALIHGCPGFLRRLRGGLDAKPTGQGRVDHAACLRDPAAREWAASP